MIRGAQRISADERDGRVLRRELAQLRTDQQSAEIMVVFRGWGLFEQSAGAHAEDRVQQVVRGTGAHTVVEVGEILGATEV